LNLILGIICTIAVAPSSKPLEWTGRHQLSVTARKDDVPAVIQAAMAKVAASASFSGAGGLIQTTSC
jgi:hypothetical protein